MWQCDSCNKRFQEPKHGYAYGRNQDNEVLEIVTEDDEGFSPMEYLNGDSFVYCPHCGSDMITDLDDL